MPMHGSYHTHGRSNSRHRAHISPIRNNAVPHLGTGWVRSTWQPHSSHLDRMRETIFNRWPASFGSGYANVYTYGSSDINNVPDKPEPLGEPVPRPDPKNVLTVKSVDFKISANGTSHHTSKFDISSPYKPNPKLVVRRGQPFVICLDLSKAYDSKKDDLRLVFEAGDKPLTSKGTRTEFILSDEDKPKEWGAKIVKEEGNSLTINVFTPPTCYVGTWAFKVDVVQKADTSVQVYRYEHQDPIYILFNPWCKDDPVYLSDEKLLNEYILNETGKIYSGSKNNITAKPWNFGQFESCVLDCALYLLDVSELNWAVRGNPIPVVRKLSAMVNSSDDGGILAGNWSGNYSGGRSPLSWTGSVAILEEYWQTKGPVKYGQCWVFSGITTTICRALGIPARSVTNFASAHDTDGSISIDVHFKPDGEVDEGLNYDSIWNFHVWNEVWMARPDLPIGYGGWQAIDATPQEASDGVFCCGPTSVLAIQQGEVNLPFDGPFLFAEVNADRLYWMPDATGKLECVYYDKKVVGKFISTKAPNSQSREDLTDSYKHREGSSEERAAVLKANQVGSSRRDLYKTKEADVKFTVEQDSENTWLGGSFVVGLRIANNSRENRTVSGRIAVHTMFYTGVVADKLKSEPFQVVVKPSSDTVHQVTVIQDEYDGKLKDCCMLDVSVWAHVRETDQNFTVKEDYRLRKPHLTAKTPPQVVLGQEFKVDVSFTNPLNTTLTNCFVAVDGLSQEYKFPQGNIAPGATFVASLPIIPEKVGNKDLIIIFNSLQLEDINVSVPVTVKSA